MKGLKLLWTWAKKYTLVLILLLILTVSLQYLYSYIALFIQYAFKVLEGGKNEVNLPPFIISFLGIGKNVLEVIFLVAISIVILQIIRLSLRFISNFLQGVVTEDISKDMRLKLYNHIQVLPYSYHNNCDTGDLIQRCTSDIDTSSSFISTRVQDFINIIATIAIGAFQVGRINMTLMWVSLIIMPVSAISTIIYFRYVNRAFNEIEESESKMMTIIQENLSNARVVRAFATEGYEKEKFDRQSDDYKKKSWKFNRTMSLFWGLSDGLTMLQYALTISVAVYLGYTGKVEANQIIACLSLMGMLIWPIRGLGRLVSDYGKTIVAAKRIQEILDKDSEFLINGDKTPEIHGNIEFSHVSFAFPDDKKGLLKDVSFSINKGETLAIIGRTGSGKSTVVNLLTRLLEYQEGEIKIDGVILKDIEKHYLRKNIGIVLQDPFLYSKTIYDNIRIASRSSKEEQIYKAASEAAIHEDILKFEKGYRTIVGEKGTTLSGGQKQRMAIARILVEDKPIIIFDDSLSAVDTETDRLIRESLKKNANRATTIIITHRITTAKEADKIIVLEDGVISEVGTHDELAQKEGLYKKLWSIQGSLEDEFNKLFQSEVKK